MNIIKDIEIQTIKLLKKNKKYVESIAKNLLLNETINYEKIKSLIPSRFENSQEITLDILR